MVSETPVNEAQPPSSAATPPSTKRPREDANEEDQDSLTAAEVQPIKRRAVLGQDILFRILLPSKQIGKVIGRGGHRIQKIREETKATIKIADAIARHEERVIIISSKDSENTFTDAENALHQIGRRGDWWRASMALLIWRLKDDQNVEGLKVSTGHVAANTIRLLISGCQAGGLIGVSGQNIGQLRNSSGATVTVLAQNQLPLCASAHESDRVVQISGDVPAVLRALVEIGCQLRDNPPKQIISISPTYNLGFIHRPPQQYVDPSSGYLVHLTSSSLYFPLFLFAVVLNCNVIPCSIYLAAEYVTLEMMISETFIGGLIGRCGSNISRIRTESGATIKVHGGKGENKHRQIHLGGSAQQVALAKQRVDEYIYTQMMQQTGGQQPMGNDLMAAQAPPMFYPPVAPQATLPLAYYGAPNPYAPQL
ncbi:K Homology domain-containing protein [Cynara cardunculus var. scolymus]|uniref:K Homology domain-containing protein n=1 Tax=Cynara cardunculus var. scolymus TaxID=59895 RepID=A0A118K0I8_CYNCS|nr:K Homology domain-containing protein [Cynara cardunculus var. scolymus]